MLIDSRHIDIFAISRAIFSRRRRLPRHCHYLPLIDYCHYAADSADIISSADISRHYAIDWPLRQHARLPRRFRQPAAVPD